MVITGLKTFRGWEIDLIHFYTLLLQWFQPPPLFLSKTFFQVVKLNRKRMIFIPSPPGVSTSHIPCPQTSRSTFWKLYTHSIWHKSWCPKQMLWKCLLNEQVNEPYIKPEMHTLLSISWLTLLTVIQQSLLEKKRIHFCPQRVFIWGVRKEGTGFAKITLQASGKIIRQPWARAGEMILGLEKRREKKKNL